MAVFQQHTELGQGIGWRLRMDVSGLIEQKFLEQQVQK